MPIILQTQPLSTHLEMIDVQGWDFEHTTGVLIVRGRETAIIETGHHRCGAQILTALNERRIPPETVQYVCVTHRHGDHCGGTTPLATTLPNVTVVGHKYAIRTLHDPSRINEGARQLFGEYAQDIQPLPSDIPTQEVEDGDQLDLGHHLELEIIGTPGHTSDHVAYFERETRTLYTGDATGLLGPQHHTVTPTSFPPSFKFAPYKSSIEKLRTYDPEFLVFSHFGAVTGSDIPVILDRALTTLESWKDTVEQAWQQESTEAHVLEVVQQRFANELEVFPHAARPRFIQIMAQGLVESLLPKKS